MAPRVKTHNAATHKKMFNLKTFFFVFNYMIKKAKEDCVWSETRAERNNFARVEKMKIDGTNNCKRVRRGGRRASRVEVFY